MKLHPVDSSNLDAVGWSNGVLTVRFQSGATYEYDGVRRGVYQRLLAADSKGRFFAEHIRSVYPYRRLGEDEWRA